MFRIPEVYETKMTFKEAVEAMTRHGRGDMLEGMNAMNRVWEEYLAAERAFANGEVDEVFFGDDDDFFAHYGYECTAYNVVFENMGKLFERA
jgi:hypothetical protein